MYHCGICHETSEPKQPVRRHVIYRNVPYTAFDEFTHSQVTRFRQEIAQEVPVCRVCEAALRTGTSYVRLCNAYRNAQDASYAASLPNVTEGPSGPRRVVLGASSPQEMACPAANVRPLTVTPPSAGKPAAASGLRGLASVIAKSAPIVLQSKPMKPAKPTTGTNSREPQPRKGKKPAPRCDMCGDEIGEDAQTTADTVLCADCIQRTKRRKK